MHQWAGHISVRGQTLKSFTVEVSRLKTAVWAALSACYPDWVDPNRPKLSPRGEAIHIEIARIT